MRKVDPSHIILTVLLNNANPNLNYEKTWFSFLSCYRKRCTRLYKTSTISQLYFFLVFLSLALCLYRAPWTLIRLPSIPIYHTTWIGFWVLPSNTIWVQTRLTESISWPKSGPKLTYLINIIRFF